MNVYTMNVELSNGIVYQHPYHLGTILDVAMTVVMEKLRQPTTTSVALRRDNQLVGIYDYRDLEERENLPQN